MLSQSRALRGALVLMMSLGYVAYTGHTQSAYAKGDDDEEDGGGDDGGDEGSGKGDEGEDEEPEEEEGQPPVTAGGLFTLKSYPIRELSRPLTLTEKIFQAKIGVGTDLSSANAFGSFGVSIEGKYGFRDNLTGLFGLTNAYNFKQFNFYAGFEASLAYDLIDFRAALRLGRQADAKICDGFEAKACTIDTSVDPPVPISGKPTGEYEARKVQASLDIGFPFRYVASPQIAIVALDTLMSINFNSTEEDFRNMAGETVVGTDGKTIKIGNKATPDLNPSLGISTNPIPALSVVIFAQLQIVDFKTDAANFKVPATARVQFSPSQKLDVGLEFTFINVKPPEGQKFYDNRFLSLFAQFRAGK